MNLPMELGGWKLGVRVLGLHRARGLDVPARRYAITFDSPCCEMRSAPMPRVAVAYLCEELFESEQCATPSAPRS